MPFPRDDERRDDERQKLLLAMLANCETVKLWTEVVDSKGSTVSQFHKTGGGGGSDCMGGWGPQAWGVGQKQWSVDSGQ